jgi:hypothetical protein
MTQSQIADIHFGSRSEAAKKRLQKLKAAAFIVERPRKPYETATLVLTTKALRLLETEGILANYPRISFSGLSKRSRVGLATVAHELRVLDIKAAFHSAARKILGITIEEFGTWPLLYEFQARQLGTYPKEVLVKPDSFIRIHQLDNDAKFEHAFFLEFDRGTETLETLSSRAGCYMDFYRSGGFAVRQGHPRSAFEKFPFRVLIVFESEERRNNFAESLLCLVPPIFTQCWLSTLSEAVQNPFGSIWVTPKAYRESLAGSPFAVDARTPRPRWKTRRSDRDLQVLTSVKKLSILD